MRNSTDFFKPLKVVQPTVIKGLDHPGQQGSISPTCGLYYKPMRIVNDDSRVITKLETSVTDDTRVVIYDHHMFIVQATVCTMCQYK